MKMATCHPDRKHYAKGLCEQCHHKEYQKTHKEKLAKICKRYQDSHKEEKTAYQKEYYRLHREEIITRSRKYYAEHKEECATLRNRWFRDNPERKREYNQKYKALSRNAEVNDFTGQQWLELLDLYSHRCAYCGEKGKLQIEHIIPLSHGGWNTKANIVPACGSCNRKKHSKIPEDAGLSITYLDWWKEA